MRHTTEVFVLHAYPPEDWGFSFRIAPEQESFPSSLLGTFARPVEDKVFTEIHQLKQCETSKPVFFLSKLTR